MSGEAWWYIELRPVGGPHCPMGSMSEADLGPLYATERDVRIIASNNMTACWLSSGADARARLWLWSPGLAQWQLAQDYQPQWQAPQTAPFPAPPGA